MRLSRPVAVMAAARNSAAATSTSAVLAKPLKASRAPRSCPSAPWDWRRSAPARAGTPSARRSRPPKPRSRCASVIQTMTAKPRMASMRWPATGRSAGVGSSRMTTSTATASSNPQLVLIQLWRPSPTTVPPADVCSTIAMRVPPGTAQSTGIAGAVLRWIKRRLHRQRPAAEAAGFRSFLILRKVPPPVLPKR